MFSIVCCLFVRTNTTISEFYDLGGSTFNSTLPLKLKAIALIVGLRNTGTTGKILASPAIGKGSDATAYDSELNLAFSSNSDGTLTIISADNYAVKQNLVTKPRARTLALDSASHKLYTVSADVDTDAPSTLGARPPLKPNTFTLLEIAR